MEKLETQPQIKSEIPQDLPITDDIYNGTGLSEKEIEALKTLNPENDLAVAREQIEAMKFIKNPELQAKTFAENSDVNPKGSFLKRLFRS